MMSMTNEQAFKEIGLYELTYTWKGGFIKIAEQLILENIEEENI